MGRFKSKPDTPITDEVKRFTKGANHRGKDAMPWKAFEPDAKPTSGMNLRLNDYELAMIRYLAKADARSMHQTLKRLLIPLLEQEVQRLTQ